MSNKQELYLIVQNVRSLFNVGALFRCADVFGVTKIFLCGYTGAPPRKEISKTALGAETWIPWEHCKQTHRVLERLQKQGVQVAALEIAKNATPLPLFTPTGPVALIVGNEVTGVTKPILQRSDVVVEIPMIGRKESLNVAVAAGIALYQIRR